MSAGRTAFAFERFSGLGQVYDSFPDRLADLLAKEHADLYNRMYSMLTDEEKEALEDAVYFEDKTKQIEKKMAKLQAEIKELKNDPYNTPEARRERFNGMSEAVMENLIATSTKEFEDKIAGKEFEINDLIYNREALNQLKEKSLLFN